MVFAKDEGGRPDAKNIYQCGLANHPGALCKRHGFWIPVGFSTTKEGGLGSLQTSRYEDCRKQRGNTKRHGFWQKTISSNERTQKKVCVPSLLFVFAFFLFQVILIGYFPSWLEGLLVPTVSKPRDLRKADLNTIGRLMLSICILR